MSAEDTNPADDPAAARDNGAAAPNESLPAESSDGSSGEAEASRRGFVSGLAAAGLGAGALAYGAGHGVEFLNPAPRRRRRETFVCFTRDVPEGDTLAVRLPTGGQVQIKRLGDDYAGFSDVCPHLGCKVSWQTVSPSETDPDKSGGFFRCPCHEGWFRADGTAFAGPPAEAGQDLKKVPLVVRGSALYVVWEEEL